MSSVITLNIQGDITVHCYYTPEEQPDYSQMGYSLGYPGCAEHFEPYKFLFPKDYPLIELEEAMRVSGIKHWFDFLPSYFNHELSHAYSEASRKMKEAMRNRRFDI